ncbi:MAG: hypothetical protein A3C44_04395 [Gammaproteobacteria bacterium RIFCSPHIGHO2_02_FULL_39_13]|nr:MAG: hypothetical protein A3C44_04395 [Gammaproteobacteria bacterium RIFCSPHIGHO2_02_FULL_39_13]
MSDQDKDSYRDLINKAIDSFCTISHENQTTLIESQKLIIREMLQERRDAEREAVQNHKEDARYQRWHTTISTIVVLGSLIAGLYVGVQQMDLSRLYKRAGWLEASINTQNTKYEALMGAMTAVRGIRAEGQLTCKNGQYAGPDPAGYQQRLFTADYKLVNTTFAPKRMFGPDVNKKIVSFVSDSSGIDRLGVCAKGAVDDNTLKKEQNEISDLITTQIDKLEQEKNGITDKIEGIENNKSR